MIMVVPEKIVFCVFLLPTALATVSVYPPDELISYVGGSANFLCIVSSPQAAINTKWIVNGTVLEDTTYTNVQQNFTKFGGGIGSLNFNDLTIDFNMTSIRCVAHFRSGTTQASTEATILLVQGTLPPVRALTVSVSGSTITYNWQQPLTLDIDDQEDIDGYEVEVINSITSEMIYFERVNVTQFSFEAPPMSWCFVPLVTVTPINVVGVGVSKTHSFEGNYGRPTSVALSRVSLVDNIITYSLVTSAPVCNSELTFVDLDTKESVTLEDSDLIIDRTNITFTTERLTENRRYAVTVKASNIESTATYPMLLSTHGIQDATVDQTNFMVSTTYFETSSERGVLLFFVYESDQRAIFKRSAFITLNRTSSLSFVLPFDLYAGKYRVFVYDIEQDGKLLNGTGYPAISTDEIATRSDSPGFIDQPTKMPAVLEDCEVNNAFRSFLVKCTCSMPKATGFQVLAQMINSDDVHRLYIAETSDCQTPASVEVEGGGSYQITVFPIRGGSGILDSDAEYSQEHKVDELVPTEGFGDSDEDSVNSAITIGTAVGVGVAIVISVIALIFGVCVWYRQQRRKRKEPLQEPQNDPHELDDRSDPVRTTGYGATTSNTTSDVDERPVVTTIVERGSSRNDNRLPPPIIDSALQPLLQPIDATFASVSRDQENASTPSTAEQTLPQGGPTEMEASDPSLNVDTALQGQEVNEVAPSSENEIQTYTNISYNYICRNSSQDTAESQSESPSVAGTESHTQSDTPRDDPNASCVKRPVQSSDDQETDYLAVQKQQLHKQELSVRLRSSSVNETSQVPEQTEAAAAAAAPHPEADPKAGKADIAQLPSDTSSNTLKRLKQKGKTEGSFTALSQPYQATFAEKPKKIAADKLPSVNEVSEFLGTLEPNELRQLGTTLGLKRVTVRDMEDDSLMKGMVQAWLKEADDVKETTGDPTWKSLIGALVEMGMQGVADTIKEETYAPQPLQSWPEFGREMRRAQPNRHTTRNIDQNVTDEWNSDVGGNVQPQFTGQAGNAIEEEIDGEDLQPGK